MTVRLQVVVGSSPKFTASLHADEVQLDAVNNRSLMRGYLSVSASSTGYYGYHDATVTGWIGGNSFAAGGTDADVASGSGGWTRGPWEFWVTHNPDGSMPSLGLWLEVTYPHLTSGSGSTSGAMGLTTLKVAPGKPTGATLGYLSDGQLSASWVRHEASNGAATSFLINASINGQPRSQIASIQPTASIPLASAANRKTVIDVTAVNGSGQATSDVSNPVWTTPAPPSDVVAKKLPDNSVQVDFTSAVAYAEHQHLVEHGVAAASSSGAAVTWDGTILTTLPSGVVAFHHVNPPPNQIHVYRVAAQTIDVNALTSAWVQSNAVQLLAPPLAPSLSGVPEFADKLVVFPLLFVHNPVDTTAQTAYEAAYSVDSGKTWISSGKKVSAVSEWAAPIHAGSVMWRVRTWGQASSGGSEGTGASPWSEFAVTTFVDLPVASILSPGAGAVINRATLTAGVSFFQAGGASPVRATWVLYQGSTVVETLPTVTLSLSAFLTRLVDGQTYTLTVTVYDSNKLTSLPVSVTFTVRYAEPVPAVVTATYLPDSGMAQLDLTFPVPGPAQVAAVTVDVTRSVNGELPAEVLVPHQPVGVVSSVIDPTPVLRGTNVYEVTTWSADGAASMVTVVLPVAEPRWTFLSTGPGWQDFVRFTTERKPGIADKPSLDQQVLYPLDSTTGLIQFGTTVKGESSGNGLVVTGAGSTYQQIEAFPARAGQVCLRDPSGRRVFGSLKLSLSDRMLTRAAVAYSVTKAGR